MELISYLLVLGTYNISEQQKEIILFGILFVLLREKV